MPNAIIRISLTMMVSKFDGFTFAERLSDHNFGTSLSPNIDLIFLSALKIFNLLLGKDEHAVSCELECAKQKVNIFPIDPSESNGIFYKS